jgi:hypothetical protein
MDSMTRMKARRALNFSDGFRVGEPGGRKLEVARLKAPTSTSTGPPDSGSESGVTVAAAAAVATGKEGRARADNSGPPPA